jgi:stage II sporulation protein M
MNVIAMRYKPGKSRKKSSSGNHAGKDIAAAIRENRGMFFLALLFLAGMVMGAIYARNASYDILKRLDFLFACNYKAKTTQSFLSIFIASFASSFIFILSCFLCGLSMWGAFLIPVIPAFRGFGLGLTAGYLYSVESWSGILYNLIVILPGAFLSCLAILAASMEAIKCSRILVSNKSSGIDRMPLRQYALRFGMVLAWACAAAALDTTLSLIFVKFFTF